MPGCSAIGGAPQQACTHQLRIDVHHLSELLTRLSMPVSYLSRCRCSAGQLADQDGGCAVYQLVWSRCWAVPGCSDIGGACQQA